VLMTPADVGPDNRPTSPRPSPPLRGGEGEEAVGGDLKRTDGSYVAQFAGPKTQGQIFQFYVRATAENGGTCVLPRGGPEEPAMFVVDNRRVPRDLRTARFVVSAHDL